MNPAIAKARQTGIGYAGVRNSCHFGAAGYYAWLAARDGLIGLAMANDIPAVAAPGSRSAVTGSNPFAYAVPAARHQPLMLDMSVATVAGGKVNAARERGEPIPATWLIGEDGLPTDDPASYPEHAVLTPAAAHKGYGLALLVETLAGCLTGAAITWQIKAWMGGDLDPAHRARRGLPRPGLRGDRTGSARPDRRAHRRGARRAHGARHRGSGRAGRVRMAAVRGGSGAWDRAAQRRPGEPAGFGGNHRA